MASNDKPLDQYIAELKDTGSVATSVLTEDPTVVLDPENINSLEKRKHHIITNETEHVIKKAKLESTSHYYCDVKCKVEVEEGEVLEDSQNNASDTKDLSKTVGNPNTDKFASFTTKRKVALLLSYCGAGYHGMQKNPDVETIELKLFEALVKINAIREEHKDEYLYKNLNQLSFNRAARTDKGVSAARQVVSMKVVAKDGFIDSMNSVLPPDIRCFGIERVTKTFDAKCSCSGRSYEYLCPSFAFAPSKDIMDSSFRLSDEQFELMNQVLKNYEGTHNFHNFTNGKHPNDRSATRYITKFQASKPFECRSHEFIAIEVSGQSFMIHQIRKMIGLCIAICRGYCQLDAMNKAWEPYKMDIPKAPGLGLLLNKVFFKKYNEKFGKDGIHTPLTWEYAELDVERFKIEHIWQTIIDEEIKKSPMVTWLKTLANHTYAQAGMNRPMDSNYKGAKGQFPPIQKDDKNDIKNNDENDVTLTTTTSNQPEVDQT